MLETFKAFARQMHVFAGERACQAGRLGTKTGAASSPRTKPLGSGRPEPAGRSLGGPWVPLAFRRSCRRSSPAWAAKSLPVSWGRSSRTQTPTRTRVFWPNRDSGLGMWGFVGDETRPLCEKKPREPLSRTPRSATRSSLPFLHSSSENR